MNKKKILVVDDEENIRILFKLGLEEEGYEVELAGSGQEALEKVKNFDFDLITLDIKMPGMSGLETLQEIRNLNKDKHIPVILCTAFEEFKQDFTSWASDDYIVKSHDLTELKRAIERLLVK
ncbi:MAG: response regulator [Proteobacteria bacterium]|nr:response regulator [Pseudomonadota bacterium]